MNSAKIIKLIFTLFFIISVKSNYAQTLRMKARAVVRDNSIQNNINTINAYINLPKVRARFTVRYPNSNKVLVTGSENKMTLRIKIRIGKPKN